MARATQRTVAPLFLHALRQRWVLWFVGLLLLLLAHATALLFRIQPAVSLWFPPSGVAIALTLWLGPIGAVLTWVASFIVAPLWGNGGWARFASLTDAIEPFMAWFLFYRCFQGTLSLRNLWNAIAFLISAPLIACGTSALLGPVALVVLGKMPIENWMASIPHWWLGNAIGTMVITPAMLLLCSRSKQPDGELEQEQREPENTPILLILSRRWVEIGVILGSTVFFALLTVQATQVSVFTTLQASLLSIIPIFWAVARFGVLGSVLTASVSVMVTLLTYLLVYPNAIALPAFPISGELLYTHKLSLLMQSVFALLAGTAITERSMAKATLEVERIKHLETEARAQLSEELLQVNRLLNEANQQLQVREEELRRRQQELKTLIENSPDIIARIDRNLRHVYVSPVIETVTGIPAEAFIGKTHAELGFPIETCQEWEALLQDIFDDGQSRTTEFTFLSPEGRIRHYESRVIPEVGVEGSVQSVIGLTRDVTELKQIERSLRQANDQFQLASEAVNSAIYDWDLQKNHIERTSGIDRVFGYSPEEIQPTSEWYLSLIHPDDVEGVMAQVRVAFASRDRYDVEYRVRNRQGDYIDVADQGLILRDEAGQVIRVVGSVADMTVRKQAETALQVSEARYRYLAEAMPQIVWTTDEQGMVTYCNERWYDYTGLNEAESLGLGCLNVVHPDDRDPLKEQWEQAFSRSESFKTELRIRSKTGTYRWFLCRSIPVHDATGQIISWVGTSTEIHEQKQIQEELRQSEERLSLALRSAQAGMWQWFRESNQTFWSDENFRLLGYEPGRDESTYENWLKAVHPDDREMAQQAVNRALEEKTPLYLEYRAYLPDRSERWLADIGQITYDAAGNPDGMIGIQIDITQRKQTEFARNQAEAALQESEERLRMALNATNQGLYDLNVQTGDAIVSPEYARMLGYEPDEFQETNQTWRERLHPDDVPTVYRVYEEYIAGIHKEYRVEFRQRTKSGSWTWILSLGKIVAWDEEGKPLRMLGTHTDINDRKQIEAERVQLLEREQAARQQAEAASRMKDEFLAVVSHELRSPLNGILGWSRLLRTRNLDPNTTEKALASIERNAQAQTQLIEDLLDISRIIRGTVRLNLRPVDLLPIVQASLDTVRPTAEAKLIQLFSQLDPNISLVSGDSDRLQQIIWNLLSNAVKFTASGGRVEIRLYRVGAHAQIQVTDTGIGISAAFLPHVFDRFRQADSTTTRTQGGLGLGLAIVRSLVELHGGTIWAESAGEGQGTTFIVELPLLSKERTESSSNAAPTLIGNSASLEEVRILVVDDEVDTREFLTIALEQFGARVAAAASVPEAFSLFQEQPPDVVLSDIGMPEENGYALIQKIRALPPERGGQVPAAALTAYVRGDDRQEALKAGFQMHVPKPIEPLQLLRVVSQLVTSQSVK
ncbi:MAG: PAS domain-containing protein [Leptolyngbyaceae cyanobacterium bins.59]|nr:PAS domain-containing protein [Leptolyngbyaceae cyanobacterium bins.59]